MISRLKDILRAELSEKLNDLGMFKDSIEDMEVNEILEKLKKQYGPKINPDQEDTYRQSEQNQYSGYKRQQEQTVDPNRKKEEEYYRNLELPYGSPFEAIKKAYRKQMKVYHPDLYHGDPEKFEMAQQVSSQLNESYVYFEKKFGK